MIGWVSYGGKMPIGAGIHSYPLIQPFPMVNYEGGQTKIRKSAQPFFFFNLSHGQVLMFLSTCFVKESIVLTKQQGPNVCWYAQNLHVFFCSRKLIQILKTYMYFWNILFIFHMRIKSNFLILIKNRFNLKYIQLTIPFV